MAHDVFISYSSVDRKTADFICSKIENRGMKCWYAPRDIEPGANWAASIDDAISKSKVMILLFTNFANKSEQVLREVTLAAEKGVIIMPIKLTNKKPNNKFKFYLKSIKWFKTTGATIDDEDVDKLVKDCEVNIHASIQSAETLKKRSKHRTVKKRIAVILTVFMAAFSIFLLWAVLYDDSQTVDYDIKLAGECILENKDVSEQMIADLFINYLNVLDDKNKYEAEFTDENVCHIIRNSEEMGVAIRSVKHTKTDGKAYDCILVYAKSGNEFAIHNNRIFLMKALLLTLCSDITTDQLDILMENADIQKYDENTYLNMGSYWFDYKFENDKSLMTVYDNDVYESNDLFIESELLEDDTRW